MPLPCPFIPPPIVYSVNYGQRCSCPWYVPTNYPTFSSQKKKLITTCILCWFGLFGRGSDYIYLLRHAKFADEVFFSLLSSFFFYSFNTCRLFCNHSFSFLMDIALPSIILEGSVFRKPPLLLVVYSS